MPAWEFRNVATCNATGSDVHFFGVGVVPGHEDGLLSGACTEVLAFVPGQPVRAYVPAADLRMPSFEACVVTGVTGTQLTIRVGRPGGRARTYTARRA